MSHDSHAKWGQPLTMCMGNIGIPLIHDKIRLNAPAESLPWEIHLILAHGDISGTSFAFRDALLNRMTSCTAPGHLTSMLNIRNCRDSRFWRRRDSVSRFFGSCCFRRNLSNNFSKREGLQQVDRLAGKRDRIR